MRNLKRVLSLALAALMLMGMMVVGAGAASKDFTDADEIKNVEAVDVMVALGVLEGGDKGDFQPNSILTREQAAKIICYLLLGEESAEKLTTNYSIFSDVPANRWSAPYISYCVNLGILAGDGNGHFFPEGKLTGVAFAKMLMVALGYNAERENFVGNNWEINVSAAAIAAGVAPKALDLSKELSRQDAAQMAFNTLSATMVEYLNDNTIIIGGETIISTTGKASAVKQYPYTDTMGIENLQFAEKYFGNLKKNANTDAFGRPAHTWVYDKKEVGTYVDSDLLVESYTTAVTGKELYNVLTASIIKECKLNVYVDGYKVDDITKNLLVKTNNRDLAHTDTGVLTEVYVDSDAGEITIAIINTYLAVATADYNEKTDKVAFQVYSYNNADKIHALDTTKVSTMVVKGEDLAIENVKDGDIVLVNIAGNAIEIISAPEVVKDTKLSAFSKGSKVVADGTTYAYAASAQYKTGVLDQYDDQNLAEATYNLYLDAYDNLIGIELVEDANTYVFITGYNITQNNTANPTAEATAIFTDGTMKTITVNVDKSTFKSASVAWDNTTIVGNGGKALENTWYSYTVNSSNVYTLTYVANQAQTTYSSNGTIDSQHIALNADAGDNKIAGGQVAYGNADSQYITVGLKALGGQTGSGIINKVKSVNTGIKNTDLTVYSTTNAKKTLDIPNGTAFNGTASEGAYAIYKNGYVVAAIVVGKDTASVENTFYALSDVNYEEYTDGLYYWSVKGIMNGVETTVRERGEWGDLVALKNVHKRDLLTLGFDSNGFVVEANRASTVTIDVAAVDSVVNETLTNANLNMKGWTLYTTTNATNGIAVADKCPTALVETVDDKTVVTYFDNTDTAIKAMQNGGKVANGTLIATLDRNKIATSVIIVDTDAQGEVIDPTDGVAESAVVNSLNPAAQTGTLLVIDRVNSGKTVDELAIEGLKNAGYTYQYKTNNSNYVALMGDRAYTFTATVRTAYLVKVERAAGANMIVSTGTYWAAEGYKITGTISCTTTNLSSVSFSVSGVAGASITVTPSATDPKVGTYEINFASTVTVPGTLTITW
ncbi:S-layer homology domain-containing protein [Flavonifractor sp. AGMB03687]|uniref:S-layer homology domain-containing protein n=1 Tax=Flavonifractor sp. AGMB03687 TaxID=2785133 RepID=UPI001ADF3BBE|nr:S-layer homology domain-containing protein [Flavonifractor sp. AGMB03687]